MASALETLCGQAFGAKKYNMLGIYMQRSWIVLFLCCFLLVPFYAFATPILKLLGQNDDVAEQSGSVALWFIPLHFSFAFQFPLQRFLQSQLKTGVLIWVPVLALVIHVFLSWVFVSKIQLGAVGVALALDISWWVLVLGMYGYVACGGCPQTWTGFSVQAFSGLLEFLKLSASSGVMLWSVFLSLSHLLYTFFDTHLGLGILGLTTISVVRCTLNPSIRSKRLK